MSSARREFLKTSGLAAVAGLLPASFFASITSEKRQNENQNNSFVIEGAYIITMDEDLGNISHGTIIVENGKILSVGQQHSLPEGFEVIDGRDFIVMPGLIDCHWHLWTSLLKSMAGSSSENGYFPLTTRFSGLYQPRDMEVATRLAAAEAINSGITTVADYNHNARNPDYVLAGCKALAESGIRAEVLYGSYRDKPETEPTPFAEIEQVLNKLRKDPEYRMISLGLGSRGPDYPRLQKDWERARELGMNISIHASQTPEKLGQIQKLEDMGILGSDVNIIHANYITSREVEAMADSNCTVTMTPYTEMRIGFGLPKVNTLYKGGINLALGVDSTALTGSANLFENMKLILNLANAEARDEFFMDHRDVLKMGTVNGARALGIDHLVGSLSPGKRADLIMLNRKDINLSIGNNPVNLAVEAGKTHNVDLVAIDGKIVKRNGALTTMVLENVIEDSREALERMSKK